MSEGASRPHRARCRRHAATTRARCTKTPESVLGFDRNHCSDSVGALTAAHRRDAVAPDTPIVVVVDALDAAVEQPPGCLPLGLPDKLPAGVYVVATTRTGGLRYVPEGTCRGLDGPQNLADLRRYLARAANQRDLAEAIVGAGISPARFTELLLERSLGVWIYISYVLEEIRQDPQKVSELPRLPHGLPGYYHNNLARLCNGPDGDLYIPLLASLAVSAEPTDAATLAAFAGIDDWRRVEYSLDHALRPYCSIRHLAGEARTRFSVRHPSLREYLAGKPADGDTGADGELADVTSLRVRLADACQDAHHRICDRYLTAWGCLHRNLPDLEAAPNLGSMDGGYALRWLMTHLLAAGREAELHRLLACGPRERNVWFDAHDRAGDVDGYLRDVGRARKAAQRLDTQLRYALVEASIASLSTTLPPALIGELVTRGLWTPWRAFSLIERMADEQQQAQALARIASLLPKEFLSRALSVAIRCREEENHATALQAVIQHPDLPGHLLETAADAVLSIKYRPGFSRAPIEISRDLYLAPMVAIAAKLPKELLHKLGRRHAGVFHQIGYARAAYALFYTDDPLQGARSALAEARELENEHDRGLLVAALLSHFPPDAFNEVLTVLGTTPYLDAPLIALAEHAPAERLGDVLDFALGRWHPKPEFSRQAAPRLTSEQLPAALRLCQAGSRGEDRAEAFAALAPVLDTDQARRFLALQADEFYRFAVWDFLHLVDAEPRLLVVSALLDRVPEREARAVTEVIIPRYIPLRARALKIPRHAQAFARFTQYLPDDLRRKALALICMGMSWTKRDAEENSPFLARFAPFSDDEVAEAFDMAETAHPISWWPGSCLMIAGVLAPHLSRDQLDYVLARVMGFPLEEECFAALAELARFQPRRARDETAERGLAVAAGIRHEWYKARAVAALAPILVRPDLAAEAFEIVWSVKSPLWIAPAMEEMAAVLPAALLQAVPDAIRGFVDPEDPVYIPRILERLSAEGYTAVIDSLLQRPEGHPGEFEAISHLAPYLSASQVRHVWQTRDMPAAAEGLSALVSRLPADERAAAVDEILTAYTPSFGWDERDARVLGQLARAASTERLTQALHEFLTGRERTLTDRVLEELSPGLPETLIEEAFQYALSSKSLSARALAKLAPRLSGSLLTRAIFYLSEPEGSTRGYTAFALAPLARQLPPQDREPVLSLALERARKIPLGILSQSAVYVDLIPQLPERLRSEAVNAAMRAVCWQLRDHRVAGGEEFDRLRAVLAVLRVPELEQLYARLREVNVPRVRAHAQAAVIRQAKGEHATGFFADGRPLHHDWPGDFDRAGLMDLLAAAAWWINRNGDDRDVGEVVEAIFDVARWWP